MCRALNYEKFSFNIAYTMHRAEYKKLCFQMTAWYKDQNVSELFGK